MKNRVCVMMSTYNGEKYIHEQIESIFYQKECEVTLFIRDDGSKDGTAEKIKALNDDRIVFIEGENIGYKRSFMELVYQVDDTYDYYAFADQDDIWLDDKLIAAISKLAIIGDCPALYYGMMTQVNENLDIMEEQQTFKPPVLKPMILFQNFVQGSTIVFNKMMLCKAKEYRLKKGYPHDVWMPILATYIGKIIGDTESHILYRKHDAAVTVEMKKAYWRNLVKRCFSNEKIDNYAIPLLQGYENQLDGEDVIFLKKLANYKSNKNYLLRLYNVRKYTTKGTLLLKAAILFNRIEVYQ